MVDDESSIVQLAKMYLERKNFRVEGKMAKVKGGCEQISTSLESPDDLEAT